MTRLERVLLADGRIMTLSEDEAADARQLLAASREKYRQAAQLLAQLENLDDPRVAELAMSVADTIAAGVDRAVVTETIVTALERQ